MARIEGVPENKAGLAARFAYWFARRSFGKVPEPLTVVAHNPGRPEDTASWSSPSSALDRWTTS